MLGICYRQLFHHAPCYQHLYRSSDRLFLKNGIKFHNIRSGGLSAVCGGVVKRYLKHGNITHAIKVHKTSKFLEILDFFIFMIAPKMLIFYHYVLRVSLTLKITPEHSIFNKISIPKTLKFKETQKYLCNFLKIQKYLTRKK